MIDLYPNFRAVWAASTEHQSNSTELPIRYAPEPKMTTDLSFL